MRPWIKLHTTILDDVRLLRLNDRQQLRYYQMYLLAGRLNNDGLFVENGSRLDETDIAIKLRISDTKQFAADVKALKKSGLIKVNGRGPYIEAFDREQVDWSRKQEQERERQAKHRHASVTRDKDVTPKRSRSGHAPRPDQTKKKIKKEKEIKNQPPPTPSTKRRSSSRAGGGNGSSSSASHSDQNQNTATTHEQEVAAAMTPILRSSGLGQKKIKNLLSKVATRIDPAKAKRYTLAALASVYADSSVGKKAVVAAYRIEQDSVPPEFTNPDTWGVIPDEILTVADVQFKPASANGRDAMIRKVAASVANR